MKIEVIREEGNGVGAYKALSEERTSAGYMTYRYDDNGDVVIEHTKVEDAFGGKGVGQKLAEQAIADARREQRKIVPVSAYMKHYLEKNADTAADVWISEKGTTAQKNQGEAKKEVMAWLKKLGYVK